MSLRTVSLNRCLLISHYAYIDVMMLYFFVVVNDFSKTYFVVLS